MDIKDWVNLVNDEQLKFRQAIHAILLAVSRDENLAHTLIFKGGIIMSLVHAGDRYTSDLDATSLLGIDELTPERLETDLERQLKVAEIELNYGLAFKVHSVKPQPTKTYKNIQYPAYKVKIGYAQINDTREMERLNNKQSHNVLAIDISFNESVTLADTECLELREGRNVLHYSLEQLIAEKYRSLLQQIERNRTRRQDVFDIYQLLIKYKEHFNNSNTKQSVLNKLKKCSQGKKIDDLLHQEGILEEQIKKMALDDFETLELEIDLEKMSISPEEMFDVVSDYFQSLPW